MERDLEAIGRCLGGELGAGHGRGQGLKTIGVVDALATGDFKGVFSCSCLAVPPSV